MMKSGPGFWLLVAILGAIVLLCSSAPGPTLYAGASAPPESIARSTGHVHRHLIFWIGISHAGTFISAILRVLNAEFRRPITR
jgi:molybdopterin-containing oxidoreductase family membrane subunit